MQILEFDLPTHWATALFYGDFCGDCLTPEDRVQILYFQITNGLCCCQDMDDQEVRLGMSTYRWLVPEDYVKPDRNQLFKNHEQQNQSHTPIRNAGNRAQDLQSADRS